MPIQERYLYQGNRIAGEAYSIRPQNRALRFGDGIFETILVRNGHAIALDLHLNRFLKGAKILEFAQNAPELTRQFQDHVEKLLKGQGHEGFGRIRITAIRNDGGFFQPIDDHAVFLGEIYPLPTDPWKLGVPKTLHVSDHYFPAMGALAGIKSLNALPYIMAAKQARDHGKQDALLLSPAAEVIELSASNVFAVIEDRLRTPPLSSGCLPGTMRTRAIEAAHALYITVEESMLQRSELMQATELFCTNAIQGLQPVCGISSMTGDSLTFPFMNRLRRHLEMPD